MAHSLTRQAIIDVLTAADVDFDDDATMVQLRPLYDQIVLSRVTNQDANNAAVSDGTSAASAHSDVLSDGASDANVDGHANRNAPAQNQDDENVVQPDAPVEPAVQPEVDANLQPVVRAPLNPQVSAVSVADEERELDRQLSIIRARGGGGLAGFDPPP